MKPWPLLALLAFPTATFAQKRPSRSAPPPDTAQPGAFQALVVRLVGPKQGGRVDRVAGVPGDPTTYYLGSASGGVWKSVDGGATFEPIFDDQPISSIGSIAVAPSDPNVVYVGSGEANVRGNVASGNGIYRSTDAGKTWEHVWTQKGQIGTIAINPRDANVAFAAVLGHIFGPNPERGVYRTTDGGKTWDQVLKKDENTGASDVAIDPLNPSIVFAGLWQARRRPWDLTSGGPGSGLYVSKDGGDTWKQLTGKGLPSGIWGKVGVAVAPSDDRRVYALIEADSGGLFRSDDGGDSWERINPSHQLSQRAWYYSTITVNPTNPDDVWFPQVPLLHSIDGGKSLSIVRNIEIGDNHDVWIDPENPKRMIDAADGGVAVSVNGGDSWYYPPLPLGQFYHVSADSRVPYDIAGAQQDIGTAQGPSNNLRRGDIGVGDWYDVGGGEAGWVVSNPQNPDIVYAGEYLGIFTRYDHRTGETRNVSAYPENESGHGDGDFKYRFQWTAPIAASPHDPNVIYHGANVIFKSSDGGQTWTIISPDLTRDDKSKEVWSGGPITGDNTGVEFYCTIFVIAESPVRAGVIWAGSDDGLVHVTQDGGASWQNVTAAMPGLPEWGTISMIEPSPFDAATAYVTVDAHRLDDTHPYLFKTTDYGKSWKRLDSALPQDIYLHSVREDPKKRGQLYLGTERGVTYSPDDGASWHPLKLHLPTVAVHDLVVKDNDLVLGTHGRSLWIFDDLTPIRMWADSIASQNVYLFPPESTIAWRLAAGRYQTSTGKNPPSGAIINYYLKSKPKGEVKLEVLDASGKVVRTLSSVAQPKDGHSEYERAHKPELADTAGIQRAVWDLALEGAKRIPNAMIDEGDPSDAPFALAGTYTLRLSADGDTSTAPLVIERDPRIQVTVADRRAQLALAAEMKSGFERLVDGVERLRSIRSQLKARNQVLKDRADAAALRGKADTLIARLDSLEHKMHNPEAQVTYDILARKGGAKLYSRMAPLNSWVTDGDGAPTQGMQQVWAGQRQELDGYLADLQRLVNTDLAALNQMAAQMGLGYIVVPGAAAAIP
jgi:photosystem II stability/assembly factor-like uncharacterized protein